MSRSIAILFVFILISACGLLIKVDPPSKSPSAPHTGLSERLQGKLMGHLLQKLGGDRLPFNLTSLERKPLEWLDATASQAVFTDTKVPSFIYFPDIMAMEEPAYVDWMQTYFGLELVETSQDQDLRGISVRRYQQQHQGIPVMGSFWQLGVNSWQQVREGSGKLYQQLNVSAKPRLSAGEARQALARQLEWTGAAWQTLRNDTAHTWADYPDARAFYHDEGLVILPPERHAGHNFALCYQIRLARTRPADLQRWYISAEDGALLAAEPLVRSQQAEPPAYSHVNTQVQTAFYGQQILRVRKQELTPADFNSGNSLCKPALPLQAGETATFYALWRTEAQAPAIQVAFSHPTQTCIQLFTRDPRFGEAPFRSFGLSDAYKSAELAWQYYQERLGRSSYDRQNGQMIIRIEPIQKNRFCPGSFACIVKGEQDLTPVLILKTRGKAGSFGSLNTLTHELSHALIDQTAKLIPYGESGAIEESICDILSVCAEFHHQARYPGVKKNANWLTGDEYNALLPVQNFMDPHQVEKPSTYRGKQFWGETGPGAADRGHVHTNSAVMNHWFYLLSEGGEGTNDRGEGEPYSVSGIGWEKAEKILYQSLIRYLGPSADFHFTREATLRAARDLYGDCSEELQAAGMAWYAVGVGDPIGECISYQFEWCVENDQGGSDCLQVFLDQDRSVMTWKDEDGLSKIVQFQVGTEPGYLVHLHRDGQVERMQFPYTLPPSQGMVLDAREQAQFYAEMGILLSRKGRGPDHRYTQADYDEDYLVESFLEQGKLVRKYRDPFVAGAYFWTMPEIPYHFSGLGAMGTRLANADAQGNNVVQNLYRGFVIRYESPRIKWHCQDIRSFREGMYPSLFSPKPVFLID